MTDEQFLEKLIRLAWDNGYELLSDYGRVKDTKLSIYIFEDVGIQLFFMEKRMIGGWEAVETLSIERIIFDHDFIKTLIIHRGKRLGVGDVFRENWLLDILSGLAISKDRVQYLKDEFEALLKD